MDEIIISKAELFNKYKSSYLQAGQDISRHFFTLGLLVYLTNIYNNYPIKNIFIIFIGLMLNRTFVVFHDCVHNCYTPSPLLNYLVSHLTGILVVTSPNWYLDHDTHHKTNGNIENLQHYFFNETIILTKKQYLNLSVKKQKIHYYYRNPWIFFTLVAYLYFIVIQRFIYAYKVFKRPNKYKKEFIYVVLDHLINNIGLYYLCKCLYNNGFLDEYLISLLLSFSINFMMFHNQHSYNPSYIATNDSWTQYDSGIKGSAFTLIPKYIKYFYMGIEYHHIHHMNSKIPGYNLQKYHEEVINKSKEFDNVKKISISEFISNLNLTLYDEELNKYISFTELHTHIN